MAKKIYTHPDEAIILNIRYIRRQKVLLDSDLAKLYGVQLKRLNQAVKRNMDRFPEDFMFQLTEDEVEIHISEQGSQTNSSEEASLRSQIVTLDVNGGEAESLRSQIATLNKSANKGRYRYLPYAFTEQGIAMLSSVLNSPTAIHVNIQIIRIFVKMREMLASHIELQKRIEEIEQSLGSTNHAVQELYDLFIRLAEQDSDERKIGFNLS